MYDPTWYDGSGKFGYLIDEFNDAVERQDEERIERAEADLEQFGAWTDVSNCWRHPDDHDLRPLQDIIDEEEEKFLDAYGNKDISDDLGDLAVDDHPDWPQPN